MEAALLASQDYMHVEIIMDGLTKRREKEVRTLYLYADRIESAAHTFPLEHVRDVSFRQLTGEGGFLYLHTSSGLYTYTIESSPEHFIRAFKGY